MPADAGILSSLGGLRPPKPPRLTETDIHSRGVAFWRCCGALDFESLRDLILVNSRGFAFWRRSGVSYVEGLRSLILMNS